jgi:hypothetical protein
MQRKNYFIAALVFLSAQLTSAQLPSTLNFQGILRDAGGNLVNTPQNLTFKIYTSATGGTALWTESRNNVQVQRGIFNVILGSITTLNLNFDRPYWLGITVGTGTELNPRTPLVSSAYSFNAKSVLGTANVFPSSGNVGIGALSPTGRLQIENTDWSNGPLLVRGLPGASTGPTITIDATKGTSGRKYSIVSTNTSAGAGAGKLVIIDDSGSAYRFVLDATGNVGIGTVNPTERLEVNGNAKVRILQITGGSDLSEQFDVTNANASNAAAASEAIQSGMVVAIDPVQPGKLVICETAYDRKVAGIISGAGGIATGMLMGQQGSTADGSTPVALAGRVYCWVDASHGAIAPGDLLTTSDTPGHAMKVSDYAKAQGAIIGKAMTGLDQGKGLVLVLVTLQ